MNQSIYFIDAKGKEYFLFQVVNFGKKDELKFTFNAKKQGTGIIHSPDDSFTTKKDVIKPFVEISYHSDGYIHYKLPRYKKEDRDIYRCRIKKIPLIQIGDWNPIIKYTVANYGLCKKPQSSSRVLLPKNNLIFNGEPFECIIWLGNLQYANPPNDNLSEIIYRINNVAMNIDLIVWIIKSSYRGKILTIPKTNITIFNESNIIQIVEKKE